VPWSTIGCDSPPRLKVIMLLLTFMARHLCDYERIHVNVCQIFDFTVSLNLHTEENKPFAIHSGFISFLSAMKICVNYIPVLIINVFQLYHK
jgi:hypothetical protein